MQFYPPHDPADTEHKKAKNRLAFEAWAAKENARRDRQRQPLSRFLRGNGAKLLIELLCDRAWALLEMGEADAADELLDFVPAARADALLNQFFPEDDNG